MARVLRMPGVTANATEAVLAEWLVEEDVDFVPAQALATVETDKAAVEVEADAAGRLLKTLVPRGAQVEVGDPIAILGEPGEEVGDIGRLLASLGVAPVTDVVVPERRDVPSDPESATPLFEAIRGPAVPARPAGQVATSRIFSSPLARKLAKDHGLAIEDITGTGPRGRILRRDVDAAVRRAGVAGPGNAAPPPPAETKETPEEAHVPVARKGDRADEDETPHSRIRLATARRLTESKREAPHFYMRASVRAEALLALRAEINGGAQNRVSVNDLVVKAVGSAHRQVPEMNVNWTPTAIRRFHQVDIAVAVSTDRGLLTPVIRGVDTLTLSAVAEETRGLADRARGGRLKQDELDGGTITVTNLGMYGVEEFAAIINPPQAAILAVGAVREEPVVENGAVVPGKVMALTLSVDHRPVDGSLAARWLAVLVDLLEHPARVLA